MKKMKVNAPKDYTAFIKAWVNARNNYLSTDYVAEQLGITKDEVRGAAMYLRNRGVMLPSLKNTVDIPASEYNDYIGAMSQR